MATNNPFSEINEYLDEQRTHFIHLEDIPNLGILLCNQHGSIIDVNNNFCELVLISKDEIKGENLYSNASIKMGLQPILTCFENFLNNTFKPTNTHMVLKNGTRILFEINTKVTFEKHILFFLKDITEENIVRNKLQTTLKEQEVFYEFRNAFLAILAHDLKSPFNTILGFLDLLKKNLNAYSSKEIEKYIGYIQNSSQKTYYLLEDLLVWANAASDKLVVTKKKYVLNELVVEVIAELDSSAKFKNMSLHLRQQKVIHAFCDARIVKIVLRNLIGNAIKFTENGGEIIIDFEQSNNDVLVSVADNGIGIAPDEINKLFKQSRIRATKGVGNEKGTGIGLSICKDLVEKHAGKIWVTSKLGKGSNFMFTIPTK